MSTKNKLISNASYIFLNWGLVTFFNMLFWLILGKTLSPTSFGITATALQIVTLLVPITLFGIDSTIGKLIPEFLQKKEKNKVQGLIKFSFKLATMTCLSTAIILFLLSPYISTLMKLEEKIILLVGFSVITMTLSYITASIYYGFQNMKKYFLTNLYGEVALVLSVSVLIFLGFDYLGAVIAYIICFFTSFITRFSKKLFRISKTSYVDKKLILKYSIPALVVVFFSAIFSNSQFILLSLLKTFEETGLFAVAMKIVSVVVAIPLIFTNALFPIISALSVDRNSKSKQTYLVSLVFRYNIFFVAPIAFFMIFFSKYLILFFSTAKYLEAISFLPFLVFGGIAIGLANQFISTLYAIGEPKKYRDTYVISTIVYLISSVVLTYYLSALGLAISYFLSSALMFTIAFLFVKKHLIIKLPIKSICKISVATAISFLFLILMRPIISNFWIAGIFVVTAGLIYLLALLVMNFYIKEDLKVLDFLSERIPMFKKHLIKFRNFLSKFATNSYTEWR